MYKDLLGVLNCMDSIMKIEGLLDVLDLYRFDHIDRHRCLLSVLNCMGLTMEAKRICWAYWIYMGLTTETNMGVR